MSSSIAKRSSAWQQMAPELELISDLMGGTRAMRAAGLRWLPREAAESWPAWRARLNRSVLFNGFARTVQINAGRPFARPLCLSGQSAPVAALSADCDGQGTSLSDLARQLLTHLLADGLVHLQLDRPAGGGPPYFVLRRAGSLIGARRGADGGLAHVRFAETHLRATGPFDEDSCPAIRLITTDSWQLWQPRRAGIAPDTDWVVTAEGRHDFGAVPLLTFCVCPAGFMLWRPPLMDLAWLNLAHWQSASDQRHILHVARVPVLFGRALQIGGDELEIGPNRLILSDDPAADMKFVEHSGAAIAAGRQDLSDLEDQMAIMGLDLLMRQTGPVTATARRLDSLQNHAALAAMVRHLEDGLCRALQMAARWMGLPATAAGQLACDPAWLDLPPAASASAGPASADLTRPETTSPHPSSHKGDIR